MQKEPKKRETQQLQAKRHEIYDEIQKYIGPIDAGTKKWLSEMIKDYGRIHSRLMTQEIVNLQNKNKFLRDMIDTLHNKGVKKEEKRDLILE
jgi:hypothetical protein